jgi:hypothetical protein
VTESSSYDATPGSVYRQKMDRGGATRVLTLFSEAQVFALEWAVRVGARLRTNLPILDLRPKQAIEGRPELPGTPAMKGEPRANSIA